MEGSKTTGPFHNCLPTSFLTEVRHGYLQWQVCRWSVLCWTPWPTKYQTRISKEKDLLCDWPYRYIQPENKHKDINSHDKEPKGGTTFRPYLIQCYLLSSLYGQVMKKHIFPVMKLCLFLTKRAMITPTARSCLFSFNFKFECNCLYFKHIIISYRFPLNAAMLLVVLPLSGTQVVVRLKTALQKAVGDVFNT